MSGGSYDYLCHQRAEQFVDGGHAEQLERMLLRVRGLGYANDVADETQSIIDEADRLRKELEKLDKRIGRISPVWRGIEWWDSNDSGEDGFKRDLEAWRRANRHVIERHGSSARCTHCDRDFGWHCPDSPDGTCHYYTDDGKVTLINGEKVDPPAGHDPKFEHHDQCVFCGHPEERK